MDTVGKLRLSYAAEIDTSGGNNGNNKTYENNPRTGDSSDLLKYLMMIHGVFFVSCFFMPMTGMFTSMAEGKGSGGGSIALLFWCVYFMPVGILAWKHFGTEKETSGL